jgi:hypothetical protein
MLQENFQDGAQILQNILNQPLTLSDPSSSNISLLSAAQNFDKNNAYTSDLYKILSTFHDYPGPTQTLITELQILIKDLSV